MLRIVHTMSAGRAKSYYSSPDYYISGQELPGQWRGKGAELLGLSGDIDAADWEALCDNRNPATGGKLLPRTKAVRRIGYDINFHAPKALSVLYALSQDERLLEAFRDAVRETMQEMEADIQTRVRKGGKDEDRTTGNMLFGEFVHFTARPVGGVPDPHLHAHCFTFNSTFDADENRWKAAQFNTIKRDAPYFQAAFHARLAGKMESLGLPVHRSRTGWTIEGMPASVRSMFSRRTEQIEQEAVRRNITDPKQKDKLGAKTRERKAGNLSIPQLQDIWKARLGKADTADIEAVSKRIGSTPVPERPDLVQAAVKTAVAHCLERSAVVPERMLLAEALNRSVGTGSLATVRDFVAQQPLLRRVMNGQMMLTSREVLAEEQAMLDFARTGRGTCPRLGSPTHRFTREWLSPEQKKAVMHVLTNTDRIILVRGAAGTGKTTLLQETTEAIKAGGKEVFAFAPSATASHGVLKNEAKFEHAETVAMLLSSERVQERARGQVILIDEAGLLGSKAMRQVFDLANALDARVVLSGDRRQHSSVERGGVLRLLEDEAGLATAELTDVRRQSGQYRAAVLALSEGRTEEGFKRLDELGWIKQIDDDDRYGAIAAEYLRSCELPGDTLVVCPTHLEAASVTNEIRTRLKHHKTLGADEREVRQLRAVNLTEAERADRFSYLAGDVIFFHKHAPGHVKGSYLPVTGNGPSLPLDYADRFTVYRPGTIRLSVGDRVRVTKNRIPPKHAMGEPRLNNGDIFTVRAFAEDGGIELSNGAMLPRNWGHIDFGYVVTSHASQGRSVDRVIIAQSAQSFRASSREQFYVSASRGKHSATIFTDDRAALLEAVCQQDNRLTATDLLGMSHRHRAARIRHDAARLSASRTPAMTRLDPPHRELAHGR